MLGFQRSDSSSATDSLKIAMLPELKAKTARLMPKELTF